MINWKKTSKLVPLCDSIAWNFSRHQTINSIHRIQPLHTIRWFFLFFSFFFRSTNIESTVTSIIIDAMSVRNAPCERVSVISNNSISIAPRTLIKKNDKKLNKKATKSALTQLLIRPPYIEHIREGRTKECIENLTENQTNIDKNPVNPCFCSKRNVHNVKVPNWRLVHSRTWSETRYLLLIVRPLMINPDFSMSADCIVPGLVPIAERAA